jgi:hypothetical protein
MACSVTAKSGQSKGLEDALGASVKGKLQEVESDLPDNLRDEALLCFEAAVANRMTVGDAITKVQKDVLSKCDEVFKGQRFKGFIKFDYDTNVVSIQINKFAGGNCQFSAGIGTKKMVCPDPFMGRLADPNMNR